MKGQRSNKREPAAAKRTVLFDTDDVLHCSDRIFESISKLTGSECGSARKQRFVIITRPRSGFHLLCFLLDRQDGIVCCTEPFNMEGIFWGCKRAKEINRHVGRSSAYRDRYPLSFLRRLWSFDTGGACLGFKSPLCENSVIENDLTADRAVKKVLLNRKNKVKQYVSYAIARQTKVWISFRNPPAGQSRVTISVEKMLDTIRWFDRVYEEAREKLIASNQTFKEVHYEDLIGPRRIDILTGVAAFLDCKNVDESRWIADPIFKQNSDRLEDLVVNYSELQESLKNTEFEQFLD